MRRDQECTPLEERACRAYRIRGRSWVKGTHRVEWEEEVRAS